MKNLKQLFRQTFSTILMLMAFCTTMQAQGISVKGTVTDGTADPLIGATIKVKGNNTLGTVTDFDGNFQLNVPSESSVLVISYVGMTTKEIKVGKQRTLKVTLQDDTQLEEVVVVGYGQQKKASVVGAITQTTGEVLERAAGIGSVGAALMNAQLVSVVWVLPSLVTFLVLLPSLLPVSPVRRTLPFISVVPLLGTRMLSR